MLKVTHYYLEGLMCFIYNFIMEVHDGDFLSTKYPKDEYIRYTHTHHHIYLF
jgi:hypothetical protein